MVVIIVFPILLSICCDLLSVGRRLVGQSASQGPISLLGKLFILCDYISVFIFFSWPSVQLG